MTVKEQVLKILKASGASVSGERLAASLEVSRNAIWKAVASLRAEGYEIEGCQNKGYTLLKTPDILSEKEIREKLETGRELKIIIYPTIDSTNNEAKRLIANGLEGVALIIADEQSGGRGRRGRGFFSPAGAGVYMTLVLRPRVSMSEAASLTTAAAVAVALAVERLSGKHVEIKWVNDVYLEGRKICGILTEAIGDFESGSVQSVLVGIGINMYSCEFPEEIRERAASLCTGTMGINRNEMIAAVTNEVMRLYADLGDKSYLKPYREHSMVIGREVDYYENDKPVRAFALDVDDTGALIVKNEDGSIKTLSGGEITLRVV